MRGMEAFGDANGIGEMAARPSVGKDSLVITEGNVPSLGDVAGVDEIGLDDLVRTDALGQLFMGAFTLAPPPMPDFVD